MKHGSRQFAGVVATIAMVSGGMLALSAPAQADDTTTSFTILAGALSISVPASSDLGSASSGGGQLTAQLGSVSVTDGRGSLLGTWTATVSSTDFTTGGGTPDETIPNSAVGYASGLATATTGVGVFTPGQATTLLNQPLSASRTAYSGTALVGNNSATWNPTLVVTLPAAAVVGTYTGTITHSVA